MNTGSLCRHLRTKSMFIPALTGENHVSAEPDEYARAPHCWCNCTLTETGPDDQPVGPETCKAGRGCFED